MLAADQRDSVAARQSAHTAWRPTPRLVNTPLTVWIHPWNTGICSTSLRESRSSWVCIRRAGSWSVDTLRCDEAAAIVGPPNVAVGQRLVSAMFAGFGEIPNPYRQFFTGRCGSRATLGWGWYGITATAWLAAEDPTSPLARLHDVTAQGGGFISRWSRHTLLSNGGRVCGVLCEVGPAPLWSNQRPTKPLRHCLGGELKC